METSLFIVMYTQQFNYYITMDVHSNVIAHCDVTMDAHRNVIAHCDVTIGISSNVITHCDVIISIGSQIERSHENKPYHSINVAGYEPEYG